MSVSDSKADRHGDNLDTPFSSQMYWLGRNLWSGTKDWVSRNRIKFFVASIAGFFLLLIFRAWVQPYAIILRVNLFPIALSLLLLGFALWLISKKQAIAGAFLLIANLGSIVAFVALDGAPRDYLGLYWHYRTIDKSDIQILPTTDNERIQPLNSIRALSGEAMTEVEQVSEPSFTRIKNDYYWTMAVEPSFAIRRATGRISEVIWVSASAPSPNFSKENRSNVSFLNGENMLLSRNIITAAIKRFGPWRFFNYEPNDVRYAQDEQGEWVQLVSLTRWKGFFCPRPVFGGVLVIEQSNRGTIDWLKNLVLGSGEWVRPSEISNHSFLKGQNLLPQRVSRFTANSFRFQQGFFSPMPGYHLGDIRIPDLPGDYNDQPFTAYFNFGEEGKLYHYFALEPFHEERQGLNTSVFVPADSLGPVKVYHHNELGEALTGVSAIVPKIMESRKNYDWSRNTAAEQRPFIRDISGKRRFFWLTTVVTYKDGTEGSYIAGSTPDVTLTDATYKSVVWVNALKPEIWEEELSRELESVWRSD